MAPAAAAAAGTAVPVAAAAAAGTVFLPLVASEVPEGRMIRWAAAAVVRVVMILTAVREAMPVVLEGVLLALQPAPVRRLDRVVAGVLKILLELAPVAVVVADTIAMQHWQGFFWDPAAAVAAVTTPLLMPEQTVVTVAVSSSSWLILSAFQGQLKAMAVQASLLGISKADRVAEERADQF
jgi:hypothetical protein